MPPYFLPLLILSLIACCIEVDISVPSFPDMGYYFNVGDGTIQMTIAYNFLGFCLGAAVYGPLSDAYGRRPIMVWGNAILLIGAMGCVISPSIPFLFCARFIQGCGASASAVVIFAMIADAYPAKDKAAQLVGSMNAVLTILMAAAPIAGGFINEAVGWRGNYSIVALICLISWVCLVFFLPETRNTFESLRFNKIKKNYQQLLSNRLFISASLVPSLSYAGYLAFITQASFLYNETYELSLMSYVLHQCAIILAFSITSLFSGKIIQKLKARNCIIIGVSLSGLSAMGMVLVSLLAPKSPYSMTFFMSLVGLGAAISYPVIFAGSLEIFPNIKGTASSMIMSMRSFLCFGFVALTSYVYNGNPLRIALIVLGGNIICLFFTVYLLRSDSFTEASSPQHAP
jgi:DHA1 family bicyclomycin/chloramphenicol resistance-like MFS transporter